MGCQSPDSQASEIVARSARRLTLQCPYSGTAQWSAAKTTDGVKYPLPIHALKNCPLPKTGAKVRTTRMSTR